MIVRAYMFYLNNRYVVNIYYENNKLIIYEIHMGILINIFVE